MAVKTVAFEVWADKDAAEQARGSGGASKARMQYVQAIMETAISASVGHRHVVRALQCTASQGKPEQRQQQVQVQNAVPPPDAAQVATYHYDFKRMDDQVDKSGSGGLQVCGVFAVGRCFLLRAPAVPLQWWSLGLCTACAQVTNGPSIDTTAAADSSTVPEVQAFKVFLIQVRERGQLRRFVLQGITCPTLGPHTGASAGDPGWLGAALARRFTSPPVGRWGGWGCQCDGLAE